MARTIRIERLIEDLTEVRHEITRINQAAGQTVFNPAATEALQRAMEDVKRLSATASCELVHKMALVETPYESDYRSWHRAARQLHGL